MQFFSGNMNVKGTEGCCGFSMIFSLAVTRLTIMCISPYKTEIVVSSKYFEIQACQAAFLKRFAARFEPCLLSLKAAGRLTHCVDVLPVCRIVVLTGENNQKNPLI